MFFDNEAFKRESNASQQRIDEVLQIISSSNKYAPRTEFNIIERATMPPVSISLGVTCGLISMTISAVINGETPAFYIVMTVLVILCELCFLFRTERLAAVSDDVLKTKRHSLSPEQIDRIVAYGRNYIYVYSCGKRRLTLGMDTIGADEFIKWAKFHDIPIEQTDDGDMSTGKKIMITVSGLLAFAAIAGVFLWFSLKAPG